MNLLTVVEAGNQSENGRHVDDPPSIPRRKGVLGQHLLEGMLGGQEYGLDVDGHCRVPCLIRGFVNPERRIVCLDGNSCIIHESFEMLIAFQKACVADAMGLTHQSDHTQQQPAAPWPPPRRPCLNPL